MTPDAFLEWCLDQEDRWEFVDGMPRMMKGATRTHDRIVVNLIAELHGRLRGKPCQPNTADIAARMAQGSVRRPDVTVDCGGAPDRSLTSELPTVFFEVLSPSTRIIEIVKKSEEFKHVPSLRHFVLIEPDTARAAVWSRAEETTPWTDHDITGLDAVIPLAAIAVELPMAAIYDGITFVAE